MIGHRRLNECIRTRMLGNVIDANAFGLFRGQRVFQFDKQHAQVSVHHVDDRLVNAHGKVRMFAERVQLEQHRTFVNRAYLLVKYNVPFGRRAARRVPAQKVKVSKYLFDFFNFKNSNIYF